MFSHAMRVRNPVGIMHYYYPIRSWRNRGVIIVEYLSRALATISALKHPLHYFIVYTRWDVYNRQSLQLTLHHVLRWNYICIIGGSKTWWEPEICLAFAPINLRFLPNFYFFLRIHFDLERVPALMLLMVIFYGASYNNNVFVPHQSDIIYH